MKGFADITLYDKDGNIVKTQHENNFITNAFEEYLESHTAIVGNPISRIGDHVRDVTSGLTLQKLVGGVVLFEDKLEDDPSIVHNNVLSVASAGTAYDYSNPLRGSLNTKETGTTEIDGKQAYRWVWDFGTSNANCTFSSVCLSTRYAGDRTYKLKIGTDILNDSNKLKVYLGTKLKDGYAYVAYDKKGRIIHRREDYICIERFFNSKKITESGQLIEYKIISPETHEWFSSNTHVIDNILYFICRNKTSLEFELLGIDLNTFEISTTTTLTGLKNSITQRIDNFGFCGKDTIVFNFIQIYTESYVSFFNLKTKEYSKDIELYTQMIGSTIYSKFCSFKTINGEMASTLTLHIFKSGPFGKTYTKMCMFYNKNDIKPLFTETILSTPEYNQLFPWVRMFNNTDMLLSVAEGYHDPIGGMIWPSGIEPLFTINNLQDPITKTEANTMKISYTLVFE